MTFNEELKQMLETSNSELAEKHRNFQHNSNSLRAEYLRPHSNFRRAGAHEERRPVVCRVQRDEKFLRGPGA